MYASFYAGMRWTALPLFALLLFLGTFLAVVIQVSLTSRRKHFQAASRLIFDDNEVVTERGNESTTPSTRGQS